MKSLDHSVESDRSRIARSTLDPRAVRHPAAAEGDRRSSISSTCFEVRPLQSAIAAAHSASVFRCAGWMAMRTSAAWTASFIASRMFAVSTAGSIAPCRLVTRRAMATASSTTSLIPVGLQIVACRVELRSLRGQRGPDLSQLRFRSRSAPPDGRLVCRLRCPWPVPRVLPCDQSLGVGLCFSAFAFLLGLDQQQLCRPAAARSRSRWPAASMSRIENGDSSTGR